jgi:hypothetical protein
VALRKRGPTAIHGRRPRSGRVSDRETDPEIRPEITFLTGGAQPVHAYTYCHMHVYAVNENENNMDHVHLGRRLVLHLYRLARKKEVWTRLESYRK